MALGIQANDWQSSYLPTIGDFQVAGFTGAATYDLPIEVPPGPGGLQPELSLSYNSQVIDQATTKMQASDVGMGWSLNVGSIEANLNGTEYSFADDAYSLNINGVSSAIIQDGTTYRLTNENFWKISRVDNGWTLQDKEGNIYDFQQPVSKFQDYGPIYRWLLSRMTNKFGQQINYSYVFETKYVFWERYKEKGKWKRRDKVGNTASYLSTITYANSRYRVRFEYEGRSDYTQAWANDDYFYAFQRQRMKNIYVENSDGTVIRRYELTYAGNEDTANLIWPGVAWTAGGKTSTLIKVQRYGLGGAAPLPAYTFFYADNMHLSRATNGYGGQVDFEYDHWYYPISAPRSHTMLDRIRLPGGGELPTGSCPLWDADATSWWKAQMGKGNVGCAYEAGDTRRMRGGYVVVDPDSVAVTFTEGEKFIQPGGVYRVTVRQPASSDAPLSEVWAGVCWENCRWDNPAAKNILQKSSTSGQVSISDIVLPTNASDIEALVSAKTSRITMDQARLELLPTFYRVVRKTVSDGNGHNYPYTYAYENPAVNDRVNGPVTGAAHTNLVCELKAEEWPLLKVNAECKELTEQFSEFRGHGVVIETALVPNDSGGYSPWRNTRTSYYQDDNKKGRVADVAQRIGNTASVLNWTFFNYAVQSLPCSSPWCLGNPYVGTTHTWVYLASQEKRVYNNNGTYAATKTDYRYEGTYGNQTGQGEYFWTGGAWNLYRWSATEYYPNAATYRVGLPARQTLFGANGNLLSDVLNFYDGSSNYQSPPGVGALTATRTLVEPGKYSQVSFTYDFWGNRNNVTTYQGYTNSSAQPRGAQTTSTAFDPDYHTYPVAETNALGQTTRWTYNYYLGLPISETDPNNVTISAEYDAFGRLTKLVRPPNNLDGPTIQIGYTDAFPFRVVLSQRISASKAYQITRQYDGMGRQTLLNAGGIRTRTDYKALNETWQSTPHTAREVPAYTKTFLDPLGRPQTVMAPDGTWTSYAYNGLTSIVTDAKGHSTTSLADVWGRAILVTPPEGPAVGYAYDPLDRLTSATRAGLTTRIGYDMAGRKRNMSDPDMGTWSYGYDASGNLTTQTDARGCVLTMSYDLLNRLTGKSSSGSGCGTQVNTTYTYDYRSRTGMKDASGTSSWSYDERGRLVSENKIIGGRSYLTRWSYNNADLPTSMTYPDGEVMNQAYDARMLLDKVSGADAYVQSSVYDSAGRLTLRKLGSGLSQTWDYYAWPQEGGRLRNLSAKNLSGATLQNLTYRYDAVGNINTIFSNGDGVSGTNDDETQNFTYDRLDRLTQAVINNGWVCREVRDLKLCDPETSTFNVYAYDPATGNLQTKDGMTLYYDDVNHKHAVSSTSSGNSYTYDANGNQVTRNTDGKSYALKYDAENRVVSVSGPAYSAAFTYDGDGLRVIGVENGRTTHYVGNYYEADPTQGVTLTNVSVPQSSFDTNTSWLTNATSPATWFWRTDWWQPNTGANNQVITNNMYGNLTSKQIPVSPNTQYELSGWVRGEIDDQQGEGGWIIRATYFNASGQQISYTDAAGGGETTINTTWAQKSGQVTTPANAAFVKVYLYSYLTSGWVTFDDISFKKIGATTNLVSDPGFESGADWTATQTSPGTWFWRANWFPHGGSAMYMITNNVYGNITSKPIPVTPNTQYDLSGWVRGELDDLQGAAGWIIRAMYFNANDQYVGYTEAAAGGGASLSTTWAQKSGQVTTHANAAFVRVYLYNYLSSGWVAFDDISFKKSGTALNLVADPSFEDGTAWTTTQSSPGTLFWRNTWDIWGEGAPHSGSYAYTISNNVYGSVSTKLMAVTPNTQYDVSTRARGETSGYQGVGGFILRVQSYDSHGQYLSYQDLKAAYQGNVLSPAWQQFSGQYTTPGNAAYAQVVLWNHRASGWAAFDNVSFKKTGASTNLVSNPGFESVYSTPVITSSTSGSYPAAPETQYQIAANIRGEKSDPNGTWSIRVSFYDSAGQLLSSKDAVSQATDALAPAGQTVRGVVVSPAGTASLKIELRVNFATGWIAFDTIAFIALNGNVKYYYAGTQRIAMRKGGVLSYLLTDHLGSTSLTTNASGAKVAELRYKPWGEIRYAWSASAGLPTNYTYTGQRSYMDDPTTSATSEGFGLMFYNARWYDPVLGRFAQADSIIPAGVQGYDRYAYVNNNPLKYTDPSGHDRNGDPDCASAYNTGCTQRDRNRNKDDKNYPLKPSPKLLPLPTLTPCSSSTYVLCDLHYSIGDHPTPEIKIGTLPTPTPTWTPIEQQFIEEFPLLLEEALPSRGGILIGEPSVVVPPFEAQLYVETLRNTEQSLRIIGGWGAAKVLVIDVLYGNSPLLPMLIQKVIGVSSSAPVFFILPLNSLKDNPMSPLRSRIIL